MNRQLYQMGGSINKARDFFMREKGLDANQADNLITQGLQAFNTVTEPQSMMQMASNGGRIGYQMGGISSMPMDFGQPLQVPQQTFMPMQPMMSSPMANYGQTPLMMQGGGIARLGYQMGGEAMMQPQMGGEMSMPQMNEQQALETIIQLLIEQGVDPETALKLAAQILQIFAQGGEPAVEAFANQLEQQEQAEAMASGGIAGYGYRQGYGFGGIGKIFKGAAKAVSGVVKGVASAVKKVVKSDIGKLALTAAAIYFAPAAFGGTTGFGAGSTYGNFFSGIMNPNLIGPLSSPAAEFGRTISSSFLSPLNIAKNVATSFIPGADKGTGGGFVSNVLTGVGLAKIGDMFAGPKRDDETDDQYQQRLKSAPGYLRDYYSNLNPDATSEQVEDFVQKNTVEYRALGGRIGYKEAGMVEEDEDLEEENNEVKEEGIMKIASNTNPLADRDDLARDLFGKPYIELTPLQQEQLNNYIEEKTSKKSMGTKFAAMGGSMIPPARRIEGGVIELDARKSGGYIPYGKKERVDDVPAMLAKDEFVFTSRAVKGAGDGSARRGAAKMYKLMKQLETKGMKMERGARA